MLRDPEALYKMGRATVTGGQLFKLKTFVDAEAEIIGYEEEMRNDNVAKKNEVGATKRSSHKENMVGKDRLGALVVRMGEIEFSIGSGFNASQRESMWAEKEELIGQLVKFKYFPTGSKDKPRFPVFLGIRHPEDL